MKGCTEPQVFTKPLRELTPETTRGFDCIEFAQDVLGISLLPWQEWLLKHMLELRPDGSYRFRTVIVEVARQNGKTTLAVVFCLWRMYVDGSSLVLGTAQNLETSEDTWGDAVQFATSVPELAAEVDVVNRQTGKKVLQLVSGARWKVATASRKGGRGKPADTVLLDELREHSDWESWAAIANTTMAQDNAIVLGISNAGDSASVVLKAKRDSGIAAVDDPDTLHAYYGWTPPQDDPIDSEETWCKANPAYGYTISREAMLAAMDAPEAKFRTENLCQWVQKINPSFIDLDEWSGLADPGATIGAESDLCVGVDVSARRDYATVAVAGFDPEGAPVVEVVARRAGMLWVEGWVSRLVAQQPVRHVMIQARGCPGSELVEVFEAAGLPVRRVQGSMLGAATGQFADRVRDGLMSHRGQPVLDVAVSGGLVKKMGDAFAWDRSSSAVDISPVVACSWALYGLLNEAGEELASSAYTDMGEWWVTGVVPAESGVDGTGSGEWWE